MSGHVDAEALSQEEEVAAFFGRPAQTGPDYSGGSRVAEVWWAIRHEPRRMNVICRHVGRPDLEITRDFRQKLMIANVGASETCVLLGGPAFEYGGSGEFADGIGGEMVTSVTFRCPDCGRHPSWGETTIITVVALLDLRRVPRARPRSAIDGTQLQSAGRLAVTIRPARTCTTITG